MCLGIPGQIVEIVDEENTIAKVDVNGVRRNVNIGLVVPDRPQVGDWVLIHVGFALSKIDDDEAQATFRFLEDLGKAYEDELNQLTESQIE
jgi:hydrogenase expression/formation protein HypC